MFIYKQLAVLSISSAAAAIDVGVEEVKPHKKKNNTNIKIIHILRIHLPLFDSFNNPRPD